MTLVSKELSGSLINTSCYSFGSIQSNKLGRGTIFLSKHEYYIQSFQLVSAADSCLRLGAP